MSVAPRRILRRRKRQAIDHEAFEKEFAFESLKSDRLRVTILLGAIISALLIVLLMVLFFYDEFQSAFHGKFKGFLFAVFIIFGANFLYLLAERRILDRLIKKQLRPFNALKYLSAFVETSIPTLGMIVGSVFLGPIYTLFTPAAFLYPLFISLSALRLNVRLCIFTGTVAGMEYTLLAFYFIQKSSGTIEPILTGVPHHLFKGFLLFLTGVVTGLVTLQVKKRILNSFSIVEERNRISRTFGEYVSPEVMGKLLDLKPDLRSENKNVCVMFLDIRNFTGFAEKRSPEEVVQYLESLFEFMIEIVNRHHGIINKFLGDGFMAVFGAPLSDGKDCANALEAAREILDRVHQEVSSGTILPTTVGIGLHAGEAVTGSIGSALRREYTVIGDVVNLAARIEKLNKRFDSQLLISEMVWQAVSDDRSKAVPMGQVQVRGREQAIQVYQVA
jgi:adenylate cyclase